MCVREIRVGGGVSRILEDIILERWMHLNVELVESCCRMKVRLFATCTHCSYSKKNLYRM